MSDGPFAVPVPAYRLGIHTARKRKRASPAATTAAAASPLSPTGSQVFTSAVGQPASRLPSDSINPLSHSPDTLRQFAVAGLTPEDENPAALYPGFPHKALPPDAIYFQPELAAARQPIEDSRSFYKGSDADVDLYDDTEAEAETAAGAASRARGRLVVQKQTARLKHIAVMTALVHRCIADGDISRAKRAFGLLAQTRDVDIKLNNFWLVGAEILMRQGETPRSQRRPDEMDVRSMALGNRGRRSSTASASPEAGLDREEGGQQDVNLAAAQEPDTAAIPGEEEEEGQTAASARWGKAENADVVRSYFEHLIAHFPYDKHRPHLVSAVDFYPALYNFEVYNISTEFAVALERLEVEYPEDYDGELGSQDSEISDDDADDDDEDADRRLLRHGGSPDSEDANFNVENDDGDEHDSSSQQRRRRRQFRQEATDEIRKQTQLLAQQVASAMDRTMETPPFASHPELLRLRANLAIFIGDLYLPTRIVEKVLRALGVPRPGKGTGSNSGGTGGGITGLAAGTQTQRRRKAAKIMDHLAKYLREPEEQIAALDMRPQEQRRARDLFRKVIGQGVAVEGWVEVFVAMVGRREDDDDEEEAVGY
ncbi:uncharacterized protein B0I36DRAFT_318494 [Microdochium trichocladiopsis]|uniref:Uncharacterized protein n=1 Tax=Microdochium trichocladiopsis TaxID=1682393 RepID=A0A9P8YBL5_9PEZI|nr:uncharacterized protein B0I36DRAFT_318494 [Microdochium trichocladiopsis]KAH7035498.1 hypothetical protein B0I36DRAFT_318494 [Microdochium trichocladiopsis]